MARCISVVCEENHSFKIRNFLNDINVAPLRSLWFILEFMRKESLVIVILLQRVIQ